MTDETPNTAGQQRSDLERRMLYEECSMCQGTGMMIFTKPGACIEGKRPCIACKSMHVVVTGLTVPQAEQMAKLDTLCQEAGISSAMLKDGRAAAFRDLLAACKAALAVVDHRDNLGFMDCAATLKAAIAKATKGE